MVSVLDSQIFRFCQHPDDKFFAQILRRTMFDFNYMASNTNKDLVVPLIKTLHRFYFLDPKYPRTQIVMFMHEGKANEAIINVCFFIVDIIGKHMASIDYVNDLKIVEFIFAEFGVLFEIVKFKLIENENLSKAGVVNLPIHRAFSQFLALYIMSNLYDPNQDW